MKKNSTTLGMNRTGIAMSPFDSKETLDEAERTPATSEGNGGALLCERALFHQQDESIGRVPFPANLRGAVETGMQKIAAKRPEAFIDKLSERLAFERTGVRMYEALINKYEALSSALDSDPAQMIRLDELRRFRDAEQSHFLMIRDIIKSLGADPTAMTPCADVVGVESLGLLQVLTDPRTSIAQSVHAILVAELTDNEGWKSLIDMAELLNQAEAAERFRGALAEEQTHLKSIQALFAELISKDVQAA